VIEPVDIHVILSDLRRDIIGRNIGGPIEFSGENYLKERWD